MPTYITPANAAIDLGIRSTDAAVLAALSRALDAAEAAINQAMNRPDGFIADVAASWRTYPAEGGNKLLIDECVEVVSVRLKYTTTDTWQTLTAPTTYWAGDGDWYPMPYNADARGRPFTKIVLDPGGSYGAFPLCSGHPCVQVSAKWGYSVACPALISQVCMMQAGRWYNQAKGGMSDYVADLESGELKYTRSLSTEFVKTLQNAGFWRPPI